MYSGLYALWEKICFKYSIWYINWIFLIDHTHTPHIQFHNDNLCVYTVTSMLYNIYNTVFVNGLNHHKITSYSKATQWNASDEPKSCLKCMCPSVFHWIYCASIHNLSIDCCQLCICQSIHVNWQVASNWLFSSTDSTLNMMLMNILCR